MSNAKGTISEALIPWNNFQLRICLHGMQSQKYFTEFGLMLLPLQFTAAGQNAISLPPPFILAKYHSQLKSGPPAGTTLLWHWLEASFLNTTWKLEGESTPSLCVPYQWQTLLHLYLRKSTTSIWSMLQHLHMFISQRQTYSTWKMHRCCNKRRQMVWNRI